MEPQCEDEIELDLPPEFCRYRDEGCELAESCLNCPFSECVYDEPGGKHHWMKKARDSEMERLFTVERKNVKELAEMFGVSRRTVQRALRHVQKQTAGKGQEND
jgi:hypothetical protein